MRLVGILLVIFGVLALAYGGIRYTRYQKVIDFGPLQATTERHEEIPLPPIIGIASVAGGIVLIVIGSRTRV